MKKQMVLLMASQPPWAAGNNRLSPPTQIFVPPLQQGYPRCKIQCRAEDAVVVVTAVVDKAKDKIETYY